MKMHATPPATHAAQALDARVATYGQLMRLHGRLNLVTAHSRAQAPPSAGAGAALGALQPESVLADAEEEDDELDVEAEDPFALANGAGGSSGDEEDGEGESDEEEDGWGAGGKAGGEEEEEEDGDLLEDDDEDEEDE